MDSDPNDSVFWLGISKGTVPIEASNVPFGVGLKTTLCPLGCSNCLNYLKVLRGWISEKQLTRVTLYMYMV